MNASETTVATKPSSPASAWLRALAYGLGNRWGMLAVAALVVATGIALNWSWLMAIGVAPLLVAVLPCVAMCALGLCMSRMTGRSCTRAAALPAAVDPRRPDLRDSAPPAQATPAPVASVDPAPLLASVQAHGAVQAPTSTEEKIHA